MAKSLKRHKTKNRASNSPFIMPRKLTPKIRTKRQLITLQRVFDYCFVVPNSKEYSTTQENHDIIYKACQQADLEFVPRSKKTPENWLLVDKMEYCRFVLSLIKKTQI